jgi:uncharacterized hydrophobic protein (TIGR00271 family)
MYMAEEENNQSSGTPQENGASKGSSEQKEQQASQSLRSNMLRLLVSAKEFLSITLNLAEDANIEGTISAIKKDMVFKGHNVWILVCSILVASIGLNLNSTAVVIGAMLISPLMGPILAIGLAVGTNDWELLKRGWKNFGVMVVISLITSTLYFFISPLGEAHSELLARTRPTFLDALIAVFGGLAGIIGVSRKATYSNVVPGVAIATALMPPLCTAGYGLATAQWEFFLGAFYLFMLNSIFISGATLVIVRYLKFPLVSFVNERTEQRVRKYMILSIIVVLLPSAWIFYGVVKETIFMGRAEKFIADNLVMQNTEILSRRLVYNDTLSRIDIFIMGEPITITEQENLQRKLVNAGLENTRLKIHQPKDYSGDLAGKLSQEVRVGVLEDIYERNARIMEQKDMTIGRLSAIVRRDSIPFENLHKEIRIQYPEVKRMAYARTIEMGRDGEVDSIPTFLVRWDGTVDPEIKGIREQVMKEWLKARLNLDTVRVVRY